MTGGAGRIRKTFYICVLAELIPLYHLYLIFNCVVPVDKKSRTASSLFFKPVALCCVSVVSLIALTFPRAPKSLTYIIDPTTNYIANVALDSYRVFKLKNDFQEKCVNSKDWSCFQKIVAKDVFPGTNTAVILAVASDALVLFKKKDKLILDGIDPKVKTENLVLTSKALLESNAFYLQENNCYKRTTPMDLSGPVTMITGLHNGYILQIVDTLISQKFAHTAMSKLTQLADKTIKKSKNDEVSRSIASTKESILYNGTHICPAKKIAP